QSFHGRQGPDERVQRVETSAAAGEQSIGEFAVCQNIAVYLRRLHRVQPESRNVLQPHIQIVVDLRLGGHGSKIGGAPAVSGEELDGGVKSHVPYGGHNLGVIRTVQFLL